MHWHLFTHSRHTIDTGDRLSCTFTREKIKKLNRCVESSVCFFFSQQAWICLQDEVIVLSVYRTKRMKPFHKPNGYMDDFDVNEVKLSEFLVLNQLIYCVVAAAAAECWFDYGCQILNRPILTSSNAYCSCSCKCSHVTI